MTNKVFVSGCFDLLHSGHAAFLKTAAAFGDVYVGVGKDETIALLKGISPRNSESERLFMVKSLRYVKDARLNSGVGQLDFADDLERLRPDLFLVNEDGHSAEKEALCARLGIAYRVLPREPEPGLPARSSSELRSSDGTLPYRAELCGGWLDQPFVNQLHPGYVICAQIAPHPAFARPGGGLATSTRAFLAQLKAAGLSRTEPEALAQLVFRLENGIDRTGHPISGAQDALGLCVPGVSLQYYDGGYWPERVSSITDEPTLRWLESHLSLYPLRHREPGFDPLVGRNLQPGAVKTLAQSSERCKNAIETRDAETLAESFAMCRRAQQALFPAMFPPSVLTETAQLEGYVRSWKFTGAGGGGWLLLMDANGLPDAIPLKISPCNDGENML